jgi:hypothetical protein
MKGFSAIIKALAEGIVAGLACIVVIPVVFVVSVFMGFAKLFGLADRPQKPKENSN